MTSADAIAAGVHSVLVVVTARGGSKRLPGKNLQELGGRSLIGWTVDFLAREGVLGQAVLSTDDESIANEGRRCGISVPFLRPAHLATDSATSAAVVLHALEDHLARGGSMPETIALLQPTSPFRRAGLMTDAVSLLTASPAANSVVAMSRLHVPAGFVFTGLAGSSVRPLGAGSEPAWVPTGSMYVARSSAFKAHGSMYAPPVVALEVAPWEAVDIDTADDLSMARAMLSLPPTRQSVSRAI